MGQMSNAMDQKRKEMEKAHSKRADGVPPAGTPTGSTIDKSGNSD
jgi:hypothetical protein